LIIVSSKEQELVESIAVRVGRRGARLLLAFLLAANWSVAAQSAPDYESAFLSYAEVAKAYDTQKMSEFMHPEGLKRFRSVIDTALYGPKKEQAEAELLPLFSVPSATDFAKLTDFEAYKRMNETVAKASPEIVEMMSTATFEVIGSFVKGDVAYVTYRLGITVSGKPVSSQVVQTLKMQDGKWLLLLPSTAEGAIAGIEARFK
jgi:hypothetical protein